MPQTLSQTQIIKSLGQALDWFEKEIGWGVAAGELNHLTGRIGELYAAMVTRGQMALETNQKGYDVVSLEGERISVKTVTTSSKVSFNASTFQYVDRIMILRLNIDDDDVSIEEYLDCPAGHLNKYKSKNNEKYVVPIRHSNKNKSDTKRSQLPIENIRKLEEISSAEFENYRITQYENGSILVEHDGIIANKTKPILREIARSLHIDILNGSGNSKNTRSLGSDIIKFLTVRP